MKDITKILFVGVYAIIVSIFIVFMIQLVQNHPTTNTICNSNVDINND